MRQHLGANIDIMHIKMTNLIETKVSCELNMSKRPTIKDVAREAGLSVATVNRVIAGAGNVREDTGRAVAEAAHKDVDP